MLKKIVTATAIALFSTTALAESNNFQGPSGWGSDYNWGGGHSNKSKGGSRGGSKNDRLGSDNAVLTNIASKRNGNPKSKPTGRSVTAYAKAKHKDAIEADFLTIMRIGNRYSSQPVNRTGDTYSKGSPSSNGGLNSSGCCH